MRIIILLLIFAILVSSITGFLTHKSSLEHCARFLMIVTQPHVPLPNPAIMSTPIVTVAHQRFVPSSLIISEVGKTATAKPISGAELKKILDNKNERSKYLIIDIRDPDERKLVYLNGMSS